MNAPRASRDSRPYNRGGIRKSRQSTPQRTDRDGDIDMTVGGQRGRASLDRNNRGSRGSRGHRGTEHRGTGRLYQPPHLGNRTARNGPISTQALEKAINNGDVNMSNHNAGSSGRIKITISGFQKNSKQMHDGWLNGFASWLGKQAGAKIDKPRKNDKGIVTVFVQPETHQNVMALEGVSYEGGKLHLKDWPTDTSGQQQLNQANQRETRSHTESSTTRDHLTSFLNSKWNRVEKTLDLSYLFGESALQNMGVFGSESTKHKFFPALMKVCDSLWDSPKIKAEMVTGISLANNRAATVTIFSGLPPTFPQLKRLSLSNNELSNIESISPWRWKFRDLEELDISQNQLVEISSIRETLKKWYPKLRQVNIDGKWEQLRSVADLTAASNPIPILAASFQDEADIAAKFILDFFPLFDADRAAVIQKYYDNHSTFSISANTKRSAIATEPHDTKWNNWIRSSRNLLKITHPPARTARLFTGAPDIQRFWETLPLTKHCDPSIESGMYMVECHSLPGVPDPSNEIPGGVAGLIVIVGSLFEEIDRSTGKNLGLKNFHRTIVLGPGGGAAGIRVVSDILNVRPQIEDNRDRDGEMARKQLGPWNLDQLSNGHPEAPADFGNAGSGKSTEQYQKERVILEFSFLTKLSLVRAEECLAGNGWDPAAAQTNFLELQVGDFLLRPDTCANSLEG
ncbi:MAG: hypothetical protein Q9160_007362 [Pyrenula sp. 1 TL-2023]